MKNNVNIKQIVVFALSMFVLATVHGQTTFQNLDFESATLTPIPAGQYGGEVSITAALPGWSASIGGVPQTEVWQNNFSTGEAEINILGPAYPAIGQDAATDGGIIDGNYTVYVQSGGNPQFGGGSANVSIYQTGTIPSAALSLRFEAWTYSSQGAFSVSFNGNSLSPVVLSSTGQSAAGLPVNVYGVNIAPYAGQTGQLEFTSILTGAPSWSEFDDITFSPNAVPEPNTLALFLTGTIAVGFRRWRTRKQDIGRQSPR
jgi:hypothetical protein